MCVRISSFDEMPYDDCLLEVIRTEGDRLEGSPKRDAYRVLQTLVLMDQHRGGVIRRVVIEPVLKELERLLVDAPPRESLMTITGYVPTQEEWDEHGMHSPFEDRHDDCPLCYADVISDEQRSWLVRSGTTGQGNSILLTMGLQPIEGRKRR